MTKGSAGHNRNKLLTPSDVAELLQISENTVYKHVKKLGGFKPGGIGVWRFRQEVIYGIMEGQDPETLVLQFSVSKRNLCGQGIQDKNGSGGRSGKKKGRCKEKSDLNRHGLLDAMQFVS
ncbi:helix-turn-helix domain-containing protein [Desulfobacter curvatus]|uniref:helix-turn-helix domain-containing protein n=1 Tax=Desulfobacter curvatus TaxID=2290 RepID=UPI000A06906E|nr:helix-turn-helix domain-containing protein [Desulfobacter curvatus]